MADDVNTSGLPLFPDARAPEFFNQLNELYRAITQVSDNLDILACGNATLESISRVQLQNMFMLRVPVRAGISVKAFTRVAIGCTWKQQYPTCAPVATLTLSGVAITGGSAGQLVDVVLMGKISGLSGLTPGAYYAVDSYDGFVLNGESINAVALSTTEMWYSPFLTVHTANT